MGLIWEVCTHWLILHLRPILFWITSQLKKINKAKDNLTNTNNKLTVSEFYLMIIFISVVVFF